MKISNLTYVELIELNYSTVGSAAGWARFDLGTRLVKEKKCFEKIRIIFLHKIVKNWLNRVEVRDLGLILWENGATPLILSLIHI